MSEKIEDAEIVMLPEMPKGYEMVPVTYDADKLTGHIKGFPLDFKDENSETISFNIYKGIIETVVSRYSNVIMTEENKREFKETRTMLNKHLTSVKRLRIDINSKIKGIVESELKPLLEAEESLEKLISETFKLQIDGFDEKMRLERYENRVVPQMKGYLAVNGEHMGVTEAELLSEMETVKSAKSTWKDYLTNSSITDNEIVRSFETLGKMIKAAKEAVTLKNHKVQTLNQFLIDTLKKVNKAKGTSLQVTDINITITAELGEKDIESAIKKAYEQEKSSKKSQASVAESSTVITSVPESKPTGFSKVITNEYDLTHEVPDGTKAVYTFAVGFKTAEEKDDFVKYLVSYPGYEKLFLKNLDTLEVK